MYKAYVWLITTIRDNGPMTLNKTNLMRQNLMYKAYVWLITTIRDNGPMTLSEINDLWIKDKVNEGVGLDRSKFFRYRGEIEENFHIVIEYNSKQGYYIKNPEIFKKDSIENWMLSTLAVNYAIGECADIKDRIGVENIPSSERFLKDIIQAMRRNQILHISYQAYGRDRVSHYTVQPYFLKLYHQRWYLIGPSDSKPVITLALDRMKRVRNSGTVFLMDKTLTVTEYLKDCYGVMKDETLEVEDILIRAFETEVNYLRDLPLHGSQVEVMQGEGWADFRLRLRPSWDFIGKLMERANRLKVMEPESVVAKIWTKHAESVKLYKEREESGEV